ncbi:hypothetical protein TGPRC2_294210 [Toxoplasma gondii TgCatPRC2]|uniref:Uncharacterized protein n=10 Tax=Toxoplasma gondii TaxID=5811 RepID=A0A125YJ80_TOXGV|nr:hypothetical protein TGME49_294210 [Toxoplasma gondii ME49]EPR57584.1 hypothetical protein TGGT1_294210 [Toxoplasma gondii GT1]ESS29295.1 hypothetical protein TGVEG_294210 [Toxoplasma gondii VEG]KAF4646142.1 hypothetical protein TGRH88_019290 [Toxoplasma gondii]KFG35613.1 hypothetical protein TGP89_294210 [Toxoplasma gondii p89]KFH14329.1 hypothetical protein TGMAS_294210 [Toxoplasma gondii MAS]KYK65898.1 hypothetical protein TGPRC2_294210 [Toxoplasma gondii TgCatPRC2]PUA86852.1 hypotheti|eukprot:XP_002370200.2 hypothetical protein TGME49_294210 [Toxoplasma gondii ME49]
MDVQCSWPGSPPCAKYSLSRGETLSILPRSRLTCSVPRSWVPNFRSGDRSLTASPRVKKIASSLQSSASVGTIPNPFTIQYRSISAPNRRPWCMSPGFASVSQSSAGLSSCITEKAVKKMTPSSVSEDFLDAFQKAFQEATAQTSKERHDRENAEQRYLCLETEMRECKKQNGALREQVASLLEKCNALVSENLKLSTELNQAKQQYDDERIKAKMFQDQVHDKLQKADALKETLQCAWKQLTSARAALSETELAAAQSKKENEQLRQDISIEKSICCFVRFFNQNRCNALQGEMRILAEQRKSETELCLSLKEQLKNFRQLQQAAGDIDSDNARLREELSRFQEDVCNLRMVEQKFASCKAELENLKQVNTQFALQIQSQQKKIESFQEKQREAEATSARLGFELKTEKQKNEELKATNELERLRCELTTEKQTVNKLQERERDLLRQCCATTQQAEEERAAQKQKMEEVHNIAKRSEDQNARLQQQIAEEELKRRQQEEEVHCLSHRLAELELKLTQLGADFHAQSGTLRSAQVGSTATGHCHQFSHKETEHHLRALQAMISVQEEVRLKEQTIRDATASEKTLRTRLLKTEEDLSACQEIMKVLERDKSLLFHYKVEFEKQAERAQEMRSRQRQHEEEISLLNEELQQRQLCHQDEINTLHSQLSDQMAREKGLADEVDRSHRRLEVLRIQLDEAEARIEALKVRI